MVSVSSSVLVRWMTHLAAAATHTPLGRHGNNVQDSMISCWDVLVADGRLTRSSLPCCRVPWEAASTRSGSVMKHGNFVMNIILQNVDIF